VGGEPTAELKFEKIIDHNLGSWAFLTIDTSDFLADGLVHVASRMAYVFDRLMALERCVILFDEVEEFCLDREDRYR
jgi:AAA+ superfamily predicted ATPase